MEHPPCCHGRQWQTVADHGIIERSLDLRTVRCSLRRANVRFLDPVSHRILPIYLEMDISCGDTLVRGKSLLARRPTSFPPRERTTALACFTSLTYYPPPLIIVHTPLFTNPLLVYHRTL